MQKPHFWVADNLPSENDELFAEQGAYWSSDGGDNTYPQVRRPIGFMRRKPRVRVKAWTMPILPKDL